MIDLHTHILPGVDDGAKTMEESLAMIGLAKELGFKGLVMTPHYMAYTKYESSLLANKKQLAALKKALEEKGLEMALFLGNEIFFDFKILDLFEKDCFTSINESRYFLVETTRQFADKNNLERFLSQIKRKGKIPILAHPERYDFVQEDPNFLIKLIEEGSLAQLNILSLVGNYGSQAKETAKILLRHEMVQFLCSDAHRVDSYQNFDEALEIAKSLVGKEAIDLLLEENPGKVIKDLEIIYREPYFFELVKKKKWWKNFLKKNRRGD